VKRDKTHGGHQQTLAHYLVVIFPALVKCQRPTSLLSGHLEPNTHHQAMAFVVISSFCAAATAAGDIGLRKLAGDPYSDSGLLSLFLDSPVKSRRAAEDSMAH
jgi:hypothetical protein